MSDKPDKATQTYAKGEINRGLERVANANVERLTNVMSQSTQGGSKDSSFSKGVDKVLEKQAENAAKTVEVMANIHETGQHPAPDKPSGGGSTSNDGGSGGFYMP